DICGAVGFALLAGRLVSSRVPRVAYPAAFRVQRKCFEYTFVRRHHPKLPVFIDDRDPVPGNVNGSGLAWGLRRTAAASTLSECRLYKECRERKRSKSESTLRHVRSFLRSRNCSVCR